MQQVCVIQSVIGVKSSMGISVSFLLCARIDSDGCWRTAWHGWQMYRTADVGPFCCQN